MNHPTSQPANCRCCLQTRHRGGRSGLIARLRRCEEGTALTEFAITLPVFLVILSGMLMLSDIVFDINRAEVTAYRLTMNEALEAQQRDAHEVIAAGDHYQVDPSQMADRVSPDGVDMNQYPPKGPTENTHFPLHYQSVYAPSFQARDLDNRQYSKSQATMANTLMPAGITGVEGLLNNPNDLDRVVGNSQPRFSPSDWVMDTYPTPPSHQQLWGRRAMQDRPHREHNVVEEIDDNFMAAFFDIDDAGTAPIVSDLALATGARYGTLGNRHSQDIHGEFLDFSFDFSYDNHYATTIPPYVLNNSATDAGLRATAMLRWTMDVGALLPHETPYYDLLSIDRMAKGIGDELDEPSPEAITGNEPYVATDPSDEELPPCPEDLFTDWLDTVECSDDQTLDPVFPGPGPTPGPGPPVVVDPE